MIGGCRPGPAGDRRDRRPRLPHRGRGARPLAAARRVRCRACRCSAATTSSPSPRAEVGADHFVVAIGDNAARAVVSSNRRARRRSAPRTGDDRAPDRGARLRYHPRARFDHPRRLPWSATAATWVGACCFGIRSSVDHDGFVADHASLGPGATTGGNVRIGRATALGLGANVIHGITIGDDTVVGRGRGGARGPARSGRGLRGALSCGPQPGSPATSTCNRPRRRDASPDRLGTNFTPHPRARAGRAPTTPERRTLARSHAGSPGGRAPGVPTARRVRPGQLPDRERRRLRPVRRRHPGGDVARARRRSRPSTTTDRPWHRRPLRHPHPRARARHPSTRRRTGR